MEFGINNVKVRELLNTGHKLRVFCCTEVHREGSRNIKWDDQKGSRRCSQKRSLIHAGSLLVYFDIRSANICEKKIAVHLFYKLRIISVNMHGL